MDIKEKILCGSSEIFKTIKDFAPRDKDYLIISDNEQTFEHTHPDEETCYFIWGSDKKMVKKYLLELPYYLSAMSLVTQRFVEYYEITFDELKQIIDRYRNIYLNSTYRYYIPLFDYIIQTHSWEFPGHIIQEAYQLYKEFKKR